MLRMLSRLFGSSAPRTSSRRAACRPQLEGLEDRRVLSTLLVNPNVLTYQADTGDCDDLEVSVVGSSYQFRTINGDRINAFVDPRLPLHVRLGITGIGTSTVRVPVYQGLAQVHVDLGDQHD